MRMLCCVEENRRSLHPHAFLTSNRFILKIKILIFAYNTMIKRHLTVKVDNCYLDFRASILSAEY